MKKISLLAGFASLLFAAAVHAAPASVASINTLLTITKAQATQEKMFDQIDPVVHQMMDRMMAGEKAGPDQKAVLDKMMSKYATALREEFAWSKVQPLVVRIYQDTFTQEEVDGMIAFYRTPVGASTIDKMPLVAQRSMTLMQERMGPVMQKMQAAMRESVNEMKDANAKAPAKKDAAK